MGSLIKDHYGKSMGKKYDFALTLHTQTFILHCSLNSSYATDRKNFFDDQELLKLVISSCFLVTFTFDSRVLLFGEILEASHSKQTLLFDQVHFQTIHTNHLVCAGHLFLGHCKILIFFLIFLNRPDDIYHVTIMPCYDKKLEASREDFYNDIYRTRDVDCVISTSMLLYFVLMSKRAAAL